MTLEVATGHVVWDWNGTLLDDVPAMVSAARHAFATCLGRVITVGDHQKFYSRPLRGFFEQLAGTALSDGQYRDLTVAFAEHYRRHLPVPMLTAGAVDLVATFRRRGVTSSICSMAPPADVRTALAVAGVEGLFTHVTGRAHDGPDAKSALLRHHLKATTAARRSTIFVGDTSDDHTAATENHIAFVAYRATENAALETRWPFIETSMIARDMTTVCKYIHAHLAGNATRTTTEDDP